ncbi:MAG: serine/threonine-protein kinase [Thermoanaerobaculia bacterium]|nr:serine/threonine-protein kinase [Thermoanaerobaculia bacterium]
MIRPGDRVGHVRVEGPLAEGGRGEVFAGFDEKLERPVALKAIRADRVDAKTRARFLNEAQILSRLDHPNICRIHGYLESPAGDFLVLERIRGRTLREAMPQGLSPAAKLAIAEAVARALEVAHLQGIVHRDLKPENVMLTEDGQVKVLDFGLARLGAEERLAFEPGGASPAISGRAASSGRTTVGELVGTPASMSPEQARGEPATSASDCFALGLLLQELLTGEPAYEPGLPEPLLLVKAADGDTRPPRGLAPDLAALLHRLLAVAPAARPTAAEAAERLAWMRARPRRRRVRIMAGLVMLGFLAGGLKYTVDLRTERSLAQTARRNAEQEAARAEAAARFLEELFRASDPRHARGTLPDARELLRRGTERLAQVGELPGQPLLRARLLDTLGAIHTELGLYDEARPLLLEAATLQERFRGPTDPVLADTLVRLGSLAQLSGREDAVDLFRRALAIRLARLGPEDPGVADILNKLGMTLAASGRFDGAQGLLQRSLALLERRRAEPDPLFAKVLHNLAGIAYYQGRTVAAETLLRRALAQREAGLPADDADLAGSREALALLLLDEGAATEAEALLAQVAATRERSYGPNHPELAGTLLNLGLARAALGRHGEARQLLARALAIEERTHEPHHPLRQLAHDHLSRHCREGHGLRDRASRQVCRSRGL